MLPSDDVKRPTAEDQSKSEHSTFLPSASAVRLKLAANKRGGINWAQPLAGENPPRAVRPDATLSF